MRFFAWLSVCAALMGLACAPDSEDGDPNAAACGASPLVGQHLWQIGNCEVGTVTPATAESCELEVCNARDASDCDGDALITFELQGVELSSDDQETIELTREIDCDEITSVSEETCALWECMIENDNAVFIGRYAERDAEEQFHDDGVWLAIDRQWPGRDECAVDDDVVDRLQSLTETCTAP